MKYRVLMTLNLILMMILAPSLAVGQTRVNGLISSGSIAAGTTSADSKAILDLVSTTKGLLPPRMTTVQRDAISSPPQGLVIFNTTTNTLNQYNGSAWGAISGGANQNGWLTNGSFDDGIGSWTVSNGSTAENTSAVIEGTKSRTITLSAVNGDIISQSVTPTGSLTGVNLEGTLWVKTALTTLQVCSLVGSLEAQCIDVPSTDTWVPLSPTMVGSGTSTVGVKLKSTSSTTGTVVVDAGYVATNRNLVAAQTLNPPTIQKLTTGSGTYSTPVGVRFIRVRMVGGGGGGSGSGTTAGTAAGAGGDTTFGSSLLTAAGGAAGGRRLDGGDGGSGTISSPAYGTALKGGEGGPGVDNTGGAGISVGGGNGGDSFFGGGGSGGANGSTGAGQPGATNTGGGGGGGLANTSAGIYGGSGGGAGGYVEAYIANPSSSYSYSVGAAGTAGGAGTSGYAGGAGGSGYIEVTEYYGTVETGFRANTVAWYVDATISGANPDLGTGTVSSWTEITNGSLTLTNNSGPNSINAGIPCASGTTNTSTATTCASANESVGITFPLPATGATKACVAFSHRSAPIATAGGNIGAMFQIVETSAANSTVVTEGKDRLTDLTTAGANTAVEWKHTPYKVCGVFNFTSKGDKTLRLVYQQSISGVPNGSLILADTTYRDIRWTVEPINQSYPAPVFTTGVVAPDNTTGVTKINTINATAKTSNYTATADDETIQVHPNGSSWTLSLPPAASYKGKKYEIVGVGSSANWGGARVIVDANGSETVCGKSTVVVSGINDTLKIQSNGSNWIGLDGTCTRTVSMRSNNGCTALTVAHPDGAVSSVSNATGTGYCRFNFTTGTFNTSTNLIVCNCTGTAGQICGVNNWGTDWFETRTYQGTSTGVSDYHFVQCTGER